MEGIRTTKKKRTVNKDLNSVFDKVLADNKDVLYEVFIEALEDIALANAMREGSNSKRVTKKRIMAILEKANGS